MRGSIHHLDLTVRDPRASCDFYDAVLGFMGYRRVREDARGFDWEFRDGSGFVSIGVMRASAAGRDRAHDRYSPGLHHGPGRRQAAPMSTPCMACCCGSAPPCWTRRPTIRITATATTRCSSRTRMA